VEDAVRTLRQFPEEFGDVSRYRPTLIPNGVAGGQASFGYLHRTGEFDEHTHAARLLAATPETFWNLRRACRLRGSSGVGQDEDEARDRRKKRDRERDDRSAAHENPPGLESLPRRS
jgi:hypothetical protein